MNARSALGKDGGTEDVWRRTRADVEVVWLHGGVFSPSLWRRPSCSMSRKAPPRGPRALLASLPLSGPAASTQPQPQQPRNALPSSSATRFGAAPPTGPRSLTNGVYPKQPPQGPKHLIGQTALPTNPPGTCSLSSNGRHSISVKGKKPEIASGWLTSGVRAVLLCHLPRFQLI